MKRANEEQVCRCELKYCERCGALWVRRAGGEESYCADCTAYMEDLPKAKSRAKGRRGRQQERTELQAAGTDYITAEKVTGEDAMLENGRAL